MHHTLIAGIGNVLMGDDAIGPTVVAHMEARFAFPEGVKVADLGTPGIGLAVHLAGVPHVLLVDAVVDGTVAVGTVRVVERDDILNGIGEAGADPHAPGLRAVVLLAAEQGGSPQRICVVGVAVRNCGLGEGMCAQVRAAVPLAVEAVVTRLRHWGVEVTERVPAGTPDVWWER